MRPKRRILLIDPLADRRGVTRFALETMRPYAVYVASSCFEAAEVGRDAAPELLLAFAPVSDEYLMDVAAGLDLPWLFIAPVDGDWPSMAEILERVRIALFRKRGPKPVKRVELAGIATGKEVMA